MQPLNHDVYGKHLHGPFYINKADKRFFIPTATGFTLNFAKPLARWLGLVFAMVVIGVLVWVIASTIWSVFNGSTNNNKLPNR